MRTSPLYPGEMRDLLAAVTFETSETLIEGESGVGIPSTVLIQALVGYNRNLSDVDLFLEVYSGAAWTTVSTHRLAPGGPTDLLAILTPDRDPQGRVFGKRWPLALPLRVRAGDCSSPGAGGFLTTVEVFITYAALDEDWAAV